MLLTPLRRQRKNYFSLARHTIYTYLLFSTFINPLIATASEATEFEIKAAYLYRFTQFVEWPATSFSNENSPFQICIIGKNPFNKELTHLTKLKYDKQKITINYPQIIDDIRRCHILYIGNYNSTREAVVLKSISSTPILTISSRPKFVTQGGIIGFVTINNRVRLMINPKTAHHANIKLSAKLLEVAISIKNQTLMEKLP